MKIVLQSDARGWGGNEKWLVLTGTGLAGRGHDVIISCHRNGPVAQRAAEIGLRITHARPAGDADIVHALHFRSFLAREQPDAVLLSAFKRAFWAGWAARSARVPRIVERLGIEQDLPQRWKYQHAFRHFIDALIVNSSAIRDRWLRSAPWFPANEVHLVLNGVVRFPGGRDRQIERANLLRSELGIPQSGALLMAAGTLEHRKGFDVLIEAFANGAPRDAHLVIAGSGPDNDMLHARAEQQGVAQRVHFIGFRDDVPALLTAGDVFVLSSRREGMANVLLEAMAADCLIVTTDVSGALEAIGAFRGRSKAGWIVPPDDPAGMSTAIGEACAAIDTPRAEALQSELRFRVDNWFSPRRMVDEVECILAGGAAS